jgi:hypothetical protein
MPKIHHARRLSAGVPLSPLLAFITLLAIAVFSDYLLVKMVSATCQPPFSASDSSLVEKVIRG